MKGYRTVVTNVVQALVGVLIMMGYVLPEGADAATTESINSIVGGINVLFGVWGTFLRIQTNTPVGKAQ